MKKIKKVFIEGAIPSAFIGQSIAKHQSKTAIGAHEIFLGQIRADVVEDKQITAIEYTANIEMAERLLHELRESTFEQFDIICMHIHHSLGMVGVGELCFFVFVSSKHRSEARKACAYIVDHIKKEIPIFGKEIFEDHSHQWKVNT